MANSIGGKIRNAAVGVLIGFLVIGFAIWGVSDVFTPRNANAVLQVGDLDVTGQEFDDAFREAIRLQGQESGTALTNEQAYQQGLHQQVLQRLQTEAVISVDADDLGIGVNRRTARDTIKDLPAFVDEFTGEFSEQKLNEALAQNRITRAQFEDDIYKSLRRQQTVPAIIGGIRAPRAMGELSYKFLTEQRKARVLTLNDKAVTEPTDPGDEVIQSYIATNIGRYTAPEYRRVTMLRVENHDLIPDLTVDDETLRASFDYKVEIGEYGAPERRTVVQIIAEDEATAQKASERLSAGEEASFVASSLGLPEPDVFNSVVPSAITDPNTAEAAFEMASGEVKTILGSLSQYYAVQVTEIIPAEIPDFESQREALIGDLEQELAADKMFDITLAIEEAQLDGLSIEEIADKVGRPFSTFDFIDRRGITQDNKLMDGISSIPGVSEDDTILTEIFINDLGFETDIFQTETGGWAIIRVDDIIDSTARPFEEVRADALNAWKTEETAKALEALALELTARARDGESLDVIAADYPNGATIDDAILVRSTPNRALGNSLIVDLQSAREGEIVTGQGPRALTRQIAKLTDIIANEDVLVGQFGDVISDQITNAISSDIQNAYQTAILKENRVIENPALVQRLLGISENP